MDMDTMPTTQFDLDENQRAMLTLCIRIAGGKFTEHATMLQAMLQETPENRGYVSLIAQFQRQAIDAEAMANRIDNAEVVTFGPEAEDEPDEDDEPEADEPDEDAITTSDDRTFYQYGKKVLEIGEDEDRDEALVMYMNRTQFWPDCWTISDHGNSYRIDLQAAYDAVGTATEKPEPEVKP